ncbi:MAG: hypothetical protein WBB45_20285 [Cyclobacteriaceae bacterium]
MQIVFNNPYLKDGLGISIQPPVIFGTVASGEPAVVNAPVIADGRSGCMHTGYLPVLRSSPAGSCANRG